jgi:chromosome segregation ATPase
VQQLESQLAAAEKQLAGVPPAADGQKIEDLQRRFELAVDDVRQLKRRNSELDEELSDYQAAAAAKQVKNSDTEPVVYDWEATKKRLLAELEEDATLAEGTRLTEDDRLSVEGTIRITDEVIMHRDQEIADLKQLLAQQTGLPAAQDSSVLSAAEAEAMDQDAIILQERERLTKLQQELQEKLRQAEVDISVQRARIARDRSDLEEQLRQLAEEKAALAGQQNSGESSAPDSAKKSGHRWLARLGLKENDKE